MPRPLLASPRAWMENILQPHRCPNQPWSLGQSTVSPRFAGGVSNSWWVARTSWCWLLCWNVIFLNSESNDSNGTGRWVTFAGFSSLLHASDCRYNFHTARLRCWLSGWPKASKAYGNKGNQASLFMDCKLLTDPKSNMTTFHTLPTFLHIRKLQPHCFPNKKIKHLPISKPRCLSLSTCILLGAPLRTLQYSLFTILTASFLFCHLFAPPFPQDILQIVILCPQLSLKDRTQRNDLWCLPKTFWDGDCAPLPFNCSISQRNLSDLSGRKGSERLSKRNGIQALWVLSWFSAAPSGRQCSMGEEEVRKWAVRNGSTRFFQDTQLGLQVP